MNAERSMQFVRLALIRSFFGAEVADGLIRDSSAAKERIEVLLIGLANNASYKYLPHL